MKKLLILLMLFLAFTFFIQADSIDYNDGSVQIVELVSFDINVYGLNQNQFIKNGLKSLTFDQVYAVADEVELNLNQITGVVGYEKLYLKMGSELNANYNWIGLDKTRSKLSYKTQFS